MEYFYHLTDAQFSTVALISATGTLLERVAYDAYGEARHQWPGDLNGDGEVTTAEITAIYNIARGSDNNIGQADYDPEADFNRDGVVNVTDYNIAVAQGAKAALPKGDLSAPGIGNTIGYCGYVFNGETITATTGALYTVRFRHYAPDLGRWIERDPIGYVDGMNLYEYVRGGPIVRLDPSGTRYICVGLSAGATGVAPLGILAGVPVSCGASMSLSCYACAGTGSQGFRCTTCCTATFTLTPAAIGAWLGVGVNPILIASFDRNRCQPIEGVSGSVGIGAGIGGVPGWVEGEISVDIDANGDITVTLPGIGHGWGFYAGMRVNFSCTACGRNKAAKLKACLNAATQAVGKAIADAVKRIVPGGPPVTIKSPGAPISPDQPFPEQETTWTKGPKEETVHRQCNACSTQE